MQIGSSSWSEVIRRGAENFGIQVGDVELKLFAAHARELLYWNRISNLTTITSPFDIAVKHMLDSIVPVKLLPAGASVLDVGTGGGFPGIPLKIIQPSLQLTLIDASRKKISFIKHLIRQLGILGIDAHQCRLAGGDAMDGRGGDSNLGSSRSPCVSESAGAGKYDGVVSRAAFSLDEFIRIAINAVKPSGQLIALKGPAPQQQFDAPGKDPNRAFTFRCSVFRYKLPYSDAKRSIVRLSADGSDINSFYPQSLG